MEITTESQNLTVKKHLEKYGSITAERAVRIYGIFRLSGRIYDLKKSGLNIRSELKFRGSAHWSQYSLIPSKS